MGPTPTNKVCRRFGESAGSYDLCSGLHRQIADDLFSGIIKCPQPLSLLDVGCGTGYLTVRLKDHFSQTKITGLDFASRMLDIARPKHGGIAWVLADGHHLPFPNGSFDMLVSNLAYQWAQDLPRVFSEARRVMKPGGILACTLFGYNTCYELFQSLDEAGSKAQFSRLPDRSQIAEALVSGGFKTTRVETEFVKIAFDGMRGLMAWFKSIGADNLSRKGFLGARAVSRAASIYSERFSFLQGVGATFEVIRIYAKS